MTSMGEGAPWDNRQGPARDHTGLAALSSFHPFL